MANFSRLTTIYPSNDLKWNVCVKILRMWRKTDDGEDSLELVVCDVFGTKMVVTIPNGLIEFFKSDIQEDAWKVFSAFDVINCSRAIRITEGYYRIVFREDTIVEDTDPRSNNHFIEYVSFDRLYDSYHAITNRCLDIMGRVINVQPLIYVDDPRAVQYEERARVLRFDLKDQNHEVIHCTAYDEHADYFQRYWIPSYTTPIIGVLRFWRAKFTHGGQDIELLSVPGVSTIYFDPPYTEVTDFRNRVSFNLDSDDDFIY
ncbi:PREDICTED: uncharacterized protein LOC104748535 [Camelina sativa]|uniref:Uncharacterized protein LOC104748535 n=1 Tax=Camelina sativa TaxID=90675 RepID=A0ABM0WB75_CAMSA|nr:PREDICTED: uncharacterized protein LOC104748535 [Camelina sativa]